ncbi:hypothetical protein fnug_2 [Pseudomonas phage fnug]|uniref:Uncharacterized protein n=1 Tax=Pseudomonas phage fnug TaxID=2719836 RepID=A0A6H2A899_9CAUD|nr:hypothetical protein fnug_2 [Pseudomonas phage fnug]
MGNDVGSRKEGLKLYEALVEDIIITNDLGTGLRPSLNITTSDGVTRNVTFDQLENFIKVIKATHDTQTVGTPLQWCIYRYAPNLVKARYIATNWKITVDHVKKTLNFQGTLKHEGTVVDHPNYDPDITARELMFDETITDFSRFEQIALSGNIANFKEEFKMMKYSFDFSYIIEVSNGMTRLKELTNDQTGLSD